MNAVCTFQVAIIGFRVEQKQQLFIIPLQSVPLPNCFLSCRGIAQCEPAHGVHSSQPSDPCPPSVSSLKVAGVAQISKNVKTCCKVQLRRINLWWLSKKNYNYGAIPTDELWNPKTLEVSSHSHIQKRSGYRLFTPNQTWEWKGQGLGFNLKP